MTGFAWNLSYWFFFTSFNIQDIQYFLCKKIHIYFITCLFLFMFVVGLEENKINKDFLKEEKYIHLSRKTFNLLKSMKAKKTIL